MCIRDRGSTGEMLSALKNMVRKYNSIRICAFFMLFELLDRRIYYTLFRFICYFENKFVEDVHVWCGVPYYIDPYNWVTHLCLCSWGHETPRKYHFDASIATMAPYSIFHFYPMKFGKNNADLSRLSRLSLADDVTHRYLPYSSNLHIIIRHIQSKDSSSSVYFRSMNC